MINFTRLLYSSIILGDLYFIQVQFNLVTCTLYLIAFLEEKQYFLLLTILFNLEKYITFLFYHMHNKYGKQKFKRAYLT